VVRNEDLNPAAPDGNLKDETDCGAAFLQN